MGDFLIVENLQKNYGDLIAVKDLSFTVKEGEVFGLLGPNGAGKTTTIKIIMGLIAPNAGEVFVDGLKVSEDPIKTKRLMGFVPDSANIIGKLTCSEFIDFFGKLYGVNKETVDKHKKRLLKLF